MSCPVRSSPVWSWCRSAVMSRPVSSRLGSVRSGRRIALLYCRVLSCFGSVRSCLGATLVVSARSCRVAWSLVVSGFVVSCLRSVMSCRVTSHRVLPCLALLVSCRVLARFGAVRFKSAWSRRLSSPRLASRLVLLCIALSCRVFAWLGLARFGQAASRRALFEKERRPCYFLELNMTVSHSAHIEVLAHKGTATQLTQPHACHLLHAKKKEWDLRQPSPQTLLVWPQTSSPPLDVTAKRDPTSVHPTRAKAKRGLCYPADHVHTMELLSESIYICLQLSQRRGWRMDSPGAEHDRVHGCVPWKGR